MQTFKALWLQGKDSSPCLKNLQRSDLPPGKVLIQVRYSSLNYKDALAVTQTAPIVRSFPIVPGIDLMGTVAESESPQYQPGDEVILTGWGIGERHWGGYSQLAQVDADWLMPLPPGLTGLQSMILGTAGLTAMLCVMALENPSIAATPRKVLVTGAAGGVGSIAIALLSRLGYEVTASSGRYLELQDSFKQLGATQVIGRLEPLSPSLGPQTWDAAVDSVGGSTLATLLKLISYGGRVAACGLAGGGDLPTTVYPFILRGIHLIGIDSVQCPQAQRRSAWERLSALLSPEILELILERTIRLEDIPTWSQHLLQGRVRGRIVVDLNLG